MRVSAVVTVVLLALSGCGDDGDGNDGSASSASTASEVEERDQDVFDFAVGDCFNDPEDADVESPEGAEVTSVGAVSCNEPHQNEVIHTFDVEDGEFPGEDALMDRAVDECSAQFESYVGVTYEESELELFPFVPTAESWEQGDREIVCAVYLPDDQKLTGTVRGAKR